MRRAGYRHGPGRTAAAKEAAEAGKKVIVLEKQPEESYAVISMAGDFGVVGSQIQKNLGIEWAPKEDILNEFVKETGGRCDTWMINYWYDHSGEDFDWFIENADYEVLESTAVDRKTDKENYIRPKCFPQAGNVQLQGRAVPVLPRHHHHEPQHAVGLPGRVQRRCGSRAPNSSTRRRANS